MVDVPQGAFHHGLGRGAAVCFGQVLFQGTGIDADADGNAVVPGGVHHGLDAVSGPPILPGLMRSPSAPAAAAAMARR